MDTIAFELKSYLRDDSFLCVFPSEVAAEFWRRRGARFVPERALRTDRFISWDTFKEEHLSVRSSLVPSNRIVRRLFAAELCIEIEKSSSLSSIVPAEHAAHAGRFAGSIAGILPSLRYLVDDIAESRIKLPEEMSRDYAALYSRYCDYLQERQLFEPAFLEPVAAEAGRKIAGREVLLVYPELIDDFDRYRSMTEGMRSLSPPAAGDYSYRHFQTTVEELDWLTERLAHLLLDGIHPGDIVVSVAGIESVAEAIAEAARIRSLPIALRMGATLLDYPQGALFERIRRCSMHDFDLQTFKSLLLDPRVPWRNRSANSKLVRVGIDARVGRNSTHDIWRERLELHGDSRIAGYYRALRGTFGGIVVAGTFSLLRRSVLEFVNSYLDASGMDEQGRRVLEAVLDTLGPFEAAEETLGVLPDGISPFSLWLEYLSEQIYVAGNPGETISVYPYRVTAGICPEYHFIVNTADESARIVHRSYPFLPFHLREDDESLGGSADVTSEFLRAYSTSGRSVYTSSSARGPRGPMLAPSEFVNIPQETGPDVVGEPDLYHCEREYWAGTRASVKRLYPLQRAGFLRATGGVSGESTEVVARSPDFTREVNTVKELSLELASRLRGETGKLSISPSGVEAWAACAFRYLVVQLLRVRSAGYVVELADPPLEGKILHELAGALLTHPDVDHNGEQIIDQLLRDLVDESQQRFPQPYQLLLFERVEKFRTVLLDLLAWDRTVVPGGEAPLVEQSYEIERDRFVLNGRIDRVSSTETGLLIVDYKRSSIPGRRDIYPPETARNFQLPLYTLLVEKQVGKVSEAIYYDMFHKKIAPVFRDGKKDSWYVREEFDRFIDLSEKQAEEMVEAIEQGDYRVCSSADACGGCPVRPICRHRYVIRRGIV